MAIGGSRRLGYIDGSIKEPSKDDPKYSEWVSENMLFMNWILNSMEGGIARSFKYLDTAKELWDSIEFTYAKKMNNARVLGLKKEIVTVKKGSLSIGDYYSQFRALWKEVIYESLTLLWQDTILWQERRKIDRRSIHI